MVEKNYIESIQSLFKTYKKLSDDAIAQVKDEELYWKPDPESNSIAIIMQHIGGNLISRWKDYLLTDGEKPYRDRDSEFKEHGFDRSTLLKSWQEGWFAIFSALEGLEEGTLSRTILIRSEPHTVLEALNRSLAHTAYHTGQIVYIAKAIRSSAWKTLSIPKGKSKEFNERIAKKGHA
jgi:hypothetical protein